MNKLLFSLLVPILISGCQTTRPSAPETSSPPAYAEQGVQNDNSSNKSETTQKAESRKLVNALPALDDAIKSQNDDGIYRAAVNVLSQNSKDIKAQNALGLFHYRKNHLLAAEYFFSKALAQNPNSSEVQNNMGLVKLAQKEKKEAVKYFRKAFELNQGNPAAAANLGSIYTEEKDYNKAVLALEAAVKRGPRDYKVLNNFGIALTATGKFNPAKERYLEAININSSGRESLLNLAILNIDHLKNNQDGLDLLGKVKFLGPPDSARNRINELENKVKAGLK